MDREWTAAAAQCSTRLDTLPLARRSSPLVGPYRASRWRGRELPGPGAPGSGKWRDDRHVVEMAGRFPVRNRGSLPGVPPEGGVSIRPVFRVAAAGLDERDFRLIEIVFRHSQYNAYDFQLLARPDPAQTDILIANPATPSGLDALSALRTLSRDVPAISALPRGTQAAARHAITIDRLTLQLLPTLNRVVEIEGLEARLEASRTEAREGADKAGTMAATTTATTMATTTATTTAGPGRLPDPGKAADSPRAARPAVAATHAAAGNVAAVNAAATDAAATDAGATSTATAARASLAGASAPAVAAASPIGPGSGRGDGRAEHAQRPPGPTRPAGVPAGASAGAPAAAPAVGSTGGSAGLSVAGAAATRPSLAPAATAPTASPLLPPRGAVPAPESEEGPIPVVATRISLPARGDDAGVGKSATASVAGFDALDLASLFAADDFRNGRVRPVDVPARSPTAGPLAGDAGAAGTPGAPPTVQQLAADLLSPLPEVPTLDGLTVWQLPPAAHAGVGLRPAQFPLPGPDGLPTASAASILPRPPTSAGPGHRLEGPRRGSHVYPLQILVADPSVAAQHQIIRALETDGVGIQCVTGAAAALRQAAERQFDLIITEYGLADVSGFHLIRALRRRSGYRSTPILLLRSRSGLFDTARARFHRDVLLLSKPLTKVELQTVVAGALRRSLVLDDLETLYEDPFADA